MRSFLLLLTATAWLPFAGAFAHADRVVDALAEHRLTTSARNGICDILLQARDPARDGTEINFYQQHRIDSLRAAEAAPGHTASMLVNELSHGILRQQMASHLRGVEVWDGLGTEADRTTLFATTYVGKDAIDEYFATTKDIADAAPLATDQLPPARRASIRRTMVRVNAALATGALTTVAALLDGRLTGNFGAAMIPVILGVAYAGYQAHRFRFDDDPVRAAFEHRAKEYVAAGPEHWPYFWDFSSVTYRVLNPLVDVLWEQNRERTADQLGRFQLSSIFPIGRHAVMWPIDWLRHGRSSAHERARGRANGYVIVDQLIAHDKDANQPRLTVIVRSSATNPLKLTTGASTR